MLGEDPVRMVTELQIHVSVYAPRDYFWSLQTKGVLKGQGTQALHRPTQRILTDLSPDFLKTQIPLRSARWAVSTVKTVQIWSSVVRLGRFPTNLVMSKTRWYFNSEWEVGENPLSGPLECLCPLSF